MVFCLCYMNGIVEAQDVSECYAVYALCWRQAIYLMLEYVAKSHPRVWEGLTKSFTVIKAFHNLSDVLPGLHI